MVGKPNLPMDVDDRCDLCGSSIDCYSHPLDQERAASMADEGGVTAATRDTYEQSLAPQPSRPAPRRGWRQWERIGQAAVVAASCCALVLSVTAALLVARR